MNKMVSIALLASIVFCTSNISYANNADNLAKEGVQLQQQGNIQAALQKYLASAKLGNINGESLAGNLFYDQGNYKKALIYLEKASNKGSDTAQLTLGIMYYNGVGVLKDRNKACDLLQKSSEQSFDQAQFNLGNCYYFGTGRSENKTKAIKLYTKAARSGYDVAQNKLAALYITGSEHLAGVPVNQNVPLAYMWDNLSFINGFKATSNKTDYGTFRSKYPYCISLGQDNIAQAYYQGIGGLTKSTSEAVSWLEKAHATDPSLGVVNLDLAKMQHNNGDDSAAFKAASEAVSQPYAPAFQYLGTMYQNGIGTDKDLIKSYAYLTVAVELYKNPDDAFYKKYAAPCMPNYKQTTGEFNLDVAEKQLGGINLNKTQKEQAEKLVGEIKGWK